MRISDWSSDVCSSDLGLGGRGAVPLDHLPILAPPQRLRFGPLRGRGRGGLQQADADGGAQAGVRGIRGHPADVPAVGAAGRRSEEHTSELQSLMRISYAVFCLKKKNNMKKKTDIL